MRSWFGLVTGGGGCVRQLLCHSLRIKFHSCIITATCYFCISKAFSAVTCDLWPWLLEYDCPNLPHLLVTDYVMYVTTKTTKQTAHQNIAHSTQRTTQSQSQSQFERCSCDICGWCCRQAGMKHGVAWIAHKGQRTMIARQQLGNRIWTSSRIL